MPMIGQGAIPIDPATAAYEPSTMSTLGQFLFGNTTGWADAKDHLRQLQYQQAMRPIEARAFQQWMGNFGPQGDQSAQQPQPQQAAAPSQDDPSASQPPQATAQPASYAPQSAPQQPDLQSMMGAGLGAALPGRPAAPVVPQMQQQAPQAQAAPARPANRFDLNDPRTQQMIVGGKIFGMPGADTVLDIAKATQPKGVVVNGRLLNEHDPNAYNQFYGDAPTKGAEPVYDRNGREVGWRMADGALSTIQQGKEAETLGATRGGLIDAPTGNGGTRKMLGGQYIDATTPAPVGGRRSGPVVPQVGAPTSASPGYAGPAGGGLGYTPSPAEQALATGRVATQVEREKLQPKEIGALSGLDSASDLTSNVIHQILGDVKDPKTGQWMPNGKPMARWDTTGGVGEVLSHVPGTPAYDLDQQLEHIRAATSMDELQKLRDNSPTGAGLGKTTQSEINMLAAMRGSIDQGQSNPQFKQNLRRQLEQLEAVRNNRRQIYQNTYGAPQGGQRQASAAPPSNAVAYLRQNPNLAAAFDAKYGPGASRSVLGQ